jgi:hypothetical protein
MKKKTQILIGALIVLAVAILAISLFVEPSGDNLAAGTMGGNAAAPRQETLKRNNMIRSALTKDTLQLRGMIQNLVYFRSFNDKVSWQIDSTVSTLRNHPLLTDQAYRETFKELETYGYFLADNGQKVRLAELMLRSYLTGRDEPVEASDAEQVLRDFSEFLVQMAGRDAVLQQAADDIDQYLDKSAKKRLMEQEVRELKGFRDKLLVDNLLSQAMAGDKGSLYKLSHYIDLLNQNPGY